MSRSAGEKNEKKSKITKKKKVFLAGAERYFRPKPNYKVIKNCLMYNLDVDLIGLAHLARQLSARNSMPSQ
jgi:hypothetical protein